MATERETQADAIKEFEQLRLGWDELYNTGPDEVLELQTQEDVFHPPIALGQMMVAMVLQNADTINERCEEEAGKGTFTMGSPEHFQFMVNCFATLTKLIGVRMYRFGQHMYVKVPFDAMVPCMCKVLTDDQIEGLLSQHMELEGDGWVIPNFYAKKEGGEE